MDIVDNIQITPSLNGKSEVKFDIPTNCDYRIDLNPDDQDEYFVFVTLKTGHTAPGTTFSTHTEELDWIKDSLRIGIIPPQPQNQPVVVTKPRIRVEY